MPIIKSAKKKMRQDKKRNIINRRYITAYKQAILKVKKEKTTAKIRKLVAVAYKKIDKAVKRGVIHKNKAARLKSAIGKIQSQLFKLEKK